MTRFKAFGIHLSISAVIVGLFVAAVVFVWYPQAYLTMEGGVDILMVLLGVDVIMGPTLTLILFNPIKKSATELRLDLTLIALMQLGAFVYGSGVIFSQRPLFLAFAIDRFYVIPASVPDLTQLRFPELRPGWTTGPILVYVRKPTTVAEEQALLQEVLAGKRDMETRPQYYEPYSSNVNSVLAAGKEIAPLLVHQPDKLPLFEKTLQQLNRQPEELLSIPIRGSLRWMMGVMDKKTGNMVAMLDIDPWMPTLLEKSR